MKIKMTTIIALEKTDSEKAVILRKRRKDFFRIRKMAKRRRRGR